jgi:hypothetical protein
MLPSTQNKRHENIQVLTNYEMQSGKHAAGVRTSKNAFSYQADSKAFSEAKERRHSNIEIFA